MPAKDGSTVVMLVVDGVETVIWRLDGRSRPDLALVDALARLQLEARRRGWSIRLRSPRRDSATCSVPRRYPSMRVGRPQAGNSSG